MSDLDALEGVPQLLFCPLQWLGCSRLRLHRAAFCQSKSPCTRLRSKALLGPTAVAPTRISINREAERVASRSDMRSEEACGLTISQLRRLHLLGRSLVRCLHGLIAKHAADGSFVHLQESFSYVNKIAGSCPHLLLVDLLILLNTPHRLCIVLLGAGWGVGEYEPYLVVRRRERARQSPRLRLWGCHVLVSGTDRR